MRISQKPFANLSWAYLGLGILLSSGLSGCTRTSDVYQGSVLPQRQQPATPLQPSPPPSVQGGDLPDTTPATNAATSPVSPPLPEETQQQNTQVATANLETNAQPVTRQALIGAWTVSTNGTNCQIFLALTKWSGGYRAASRGCTAPDIAGVQAWDVKGKQVVLVDSSGGTAATLYRSADKRFDGSTNGGNAISFSR